MKKTTTMITTAMTLAPWMDESRKTIKNQQHQIQQQFCDDNNSDYTADRTTININNNNTVNTTTNADMPCCGPCL
jgi:adenosylcobinamide amidohydrolase